MYTHLTSQQRYAISTFIQNGWSRAKIADSIGVNPSTVTREINRNSGVRRTYNWETAQKNADYRKIRRPGNRAISQEIKDEAVRLLVEEQWSPEQISAALKEQGMSISGLMVKCTPERGQKCSLFHLMVKCTPIIVELPSVYRGCKPLICFQ